jgi:hypothetical protein
MGTISNALPRQAKAAIRASYELHLSLTTMKSFLTAAAFASGLASVAAQNMNGNMTMGGQNPEYRNSSSSTACADVHFMVVRGSREPKGQGMIGTLATM